MSRIPTVAPDEARGIRRLLVFWAKRQYGGVLPGIFQILLSSLPLTFASSIIYNNFHLRKSSPFSRTQREMIATVVNGIIGGAPWLGMHTAAVRRLTGDEHLTHEFATTWPEYDLDEPTRVLLGYAKKLTESPQMIDDADIDRLRTAGWDDDAIYEATALISFFNFGGRMEAASGLPMDEIPSTATMAEAQQDGRPATEGVD